MPRCSECNNPVLSGAVLDVECLNKLRAAAHGKVYCCPVCENSEHPADAKFCKICGTPTDDGEKR